MKPRTRSMGSRLFLDTNVFLDLLLDRGVFGKAIKCLLVKAEESRAELYTSISCIQTIIYFLENGKFSRESIRDFVVFVNELVTISQTTNNDVSKAMKSDFRDLEDAILFQTALSNDCEVFITRNVKDFPVSTSQMSVVKPEDY